MKNFNVQLVVNGNPHAEFGADEEKGFTMRFSPELIAGIELLDWDGMGRSFIPMLEGMINQNKALEEAKAKVQAARGVGQDLPEPMKSQVMMIGMAIEKAVQDREDGLLEELIKVVRGKWTSLIKDVEGKVLTAEEYADAHPDSPRGHLINLFRGNQPEGEKPVVEEPANKPEGTE